MIDIDNLKKKIQILTDPQLYKIVDIVSIYNLNKTDEQLYISFFIKETVQSIEQLYKENKEACFSILHYIFKLEKETFIFESLNWNSYLYLFINNKIKKDFLSHEENLFVFLKRPFVSNFYVSLNKEKFGEMNPEIRIYPNFSKLFCKNNFIDSDLLYKIFQKEKDSPDFFINGMISSLFVQLTSGNNSADKNINKLSREKTKISELIYNKYRLITFKLFSGFEYISSFLLIGAFVSIIGLLATIILSIFYLFDGSYYTSLYYIFLLFVNGVSLKFQWVNIKYKYKFFKLKKSSVIFSNIIQNMESINIESILSFIPKIKNNKDFFNKGKLTKKGLQSIKMNTII